MVAPHTRRRHAGGPRPTKNMQDRSVVLRPDAPSINDVPQLGGRGALYLLALVQAQQARQRVAPTLDATANLLSVLDSLGVVRFEHHQTPTSNLTVGDQLPWTYTWPQIPFDGLERSLIDYLTGQGRSAAFAETWLRIWQELIPSEVIAYLQHQLRIHQFSDVFLAVLSPLLLARESRYSLGQWRYACWASVRRMASVSLQQPGNEEILRVTLGTELPRRLQIALGAPEGKLCFSPSHSIPTCALSSALFHVATSLEDDFWRSPPAIDLL